MEAANYKEEDEVDGLAVVVAAARREEVVVEVGRKEAARVAEVLAAEEAHVVGALVAEEDPMAATNERVNAVSKDGEHNVHLIPHRHLQVAGNPVGMEQEEEDGGQQRQAMAGVQDALLEEGVGCWVVPNESVGYYLQL